ncbi:LytR/AlgR family response regulator transcription factor [Leadbetterella byssophila]|jgi:two-component system LytT family response regulator|uniref:LytR/AlgR family response regulator transcription factor n=1 Tax=Leadbetterella byssophila TaxID=316068 RepID=UPI0039A261A3
MTFRCIIVDDNEVDRLTVSAYVRRFPFLEITGIYGSAEDALADIQSSDPQVLFLDIDMGDQSGLDLRRALLEVEACIFITSHPEYAVDSFEVAALDFLVKPLHLDRFTASMQRLESYLEIKNKSHLFDHSLQGDTVFIKDGQRQHKVRLSEILYLEALKDYTRIVTPEKKYTVLSTLGNLLRESPFSGFVRSHRSFAVQPHFVQEISSSDLLVNGIKIPIGRSYKDQVLHQIRC